MAQYDGQIVFGVKIDEKEAQTGLKRIENMIKVGVAALSGKKLAEIAKMGVDYNAQMEQFQASFETMLGDAKKAAEHISQLKKMAAKTPFEMTDLAQASQTLQAFGVEAQEIEPTLKMLGDISLGNKERFNGLALVFGQVKSQGKLMGQDLLQMINQGFNPLQIISQKTGESMSDLKKRMSEGKVSFEEVAEAMTIATSAGGKFYGGLEKQSQTLNGQISTMKDNLKSLLGQMTQPLFKKIKDDYLPKVNNLIDYLSKHSKNIVKILGELAKSALAAIKPFLHPILKWIKDSFLPKVISGAKSLAENSETLVKVLQVVITTLIAIKGLKIVALITQTIKSIGMLNLALSTLGGPIGMAIAAIGTLAAGWVLFGEKTESSGDKVQRVTQELINEHRALQNSYKERIEEIDKAMEAEIDEINQIGELKGELDSLVDSNGNVIAGYEDRARVVADELSKATGVELEIVNGQIQNYKELSKEIDNFVLKKEAEIALKASEEKYIAAIENRDKEIEQYIKLSEQYDKQQEKLKKLRSENGKYDRAREASIQTTQQELERLNAEMEESAKAVEDAETKKKQYTEMYANFAKGEYGKVSGAMEEFIGVQARVSRANQDELEKMHNSTETALDGLRGLYERTGDSTVQSLLNSKNEELRIINEKMDGINSSATQGFSQYDAKMKELANTGITQAERDRDASIRVMGDKHQRLNEITSQMTGDYVGTIQRMTTDGLSMLKKDTPEWKKTGTDKMNRLSSGVEGNTKAVTGATSEVSKKAISAYKRAQGNQWHGIGIGIVDGVTAGVGNEGARSSLFSSLKSLAASALSAAQSALGINSPSKLFRDRIGVSIPEGIAVGIEKSGALVGDAIKKVADKALEIGIEKRKELTAVMGDMAGLNSRLDAQTYKTFGKGFKRTTPSENALHKSDNTPTISQEINIYQPVKTPAEMKKALRKEAIMLGLAGGIV